MVLSNLLGCFGLWAPSLLEWAGKESPAMSRGVARVRECLSCVHMCLPCACRFLLGFGSR